MISLGAELAADLSAMDAATPPSGSAAAIDGQDADLFNAMLGQMMGQGDTAMRANSPEGADPVLDEDSADAAIDPTALVNPMVVDGFLPAPPPPVATMVWTIAAVAPSSLPGDAAAVGQGADLGSFVALDAPAGMPSAVGGPLVEPLPVDPPPVDPRPTGQPVDGPAPSSPTLAEALTAAPPPVAREALPRAIAGDMPARAAAEDAAIPPPLVPSPSPSGPAVAEPERGAQSDVGPQIAEALNRQERPSRSPKQDKAPVEPKLDAAGIRPLPMAAVERAYAGNEQGASKSFDAPREQAPIAPASSGQAPAAPVFVVPADGRAMLSTPPAVAANTVGIPAPVERDIDTFVPPQIVQSIRMQAHSGGGEAVIRLNPDYLGEVIVAVKVEQGSVTASLQAETPAVRQWAERNESTLRQALAEQGLQLDKLTVTEKASEAESENGHESARDEAREEHSQQQPRRRRPQSDDATFEVTV